MGQVEALLEMIGLSALQGIKHKSEPIALKFNGDRSPTEGVKKLVRVTRHVCERSTSSLAQVEDAEELALRRTGHCGVGIEGRPFR